MPDPRFLKIPVIMSIPERDAMYEYVRKLKPLACLEVGSAQGGSAFVITTALRENGKGHLTCVSAPPDRRNQRLWRGFRKLATYHSARAEELLPTWVGQRTFDFAFIDGDHNTEAVTIDIRNVAALMPHGGYIVLHDSNNTGVWAGITAALVENGKHLTEETPLVPPNPNEVYNGIVWGGLTVLRRHPG